MQRNFFAYYKSNKGTKSAERAFSSAFLMWGNTGNDEYVEEAVATLDYDSKLWSFLLRPLGNIYSKNQNRDFKNYIGYLVNLENNLTHPRSRSILYIILLDHYKTNKENDKAQDYAQKIIEMDANEFSVKIARGELHELESFQIGQPAPAFNAKTVSGEELSLSELNGKFVLLEFWGTWCGPCYPEIPHLKELDEKHKKTLTASRYCAG